MKEMFIEYKHNNDALEAYCAYPDSELSSSFPLVLVSHAWAGRDDFAINVARDLAHKGYVGFALDLYGKNKIGKTTEEKSALMKKLGGKQLILDLKEPLKTIPDSLSNSLLELNSNGTQLIYNYNSNNCENNITDLLTKLSTAGISYNDIHTKQVSLEEIFIKLVIST